MPLMIDDIRCNNTSLYIYIYIYSILGAFLDVVIYEKTLSQQLHGCVVDALKFLAGFLVVIRWPVCMCVCVHV